MKTNLFTFKFLTLLIGGALFQPVLTFAQTAEWRLVMKNLSHDDPDGGGPAKGSVQFDLEMHAVSGTIAAREISVGYSYQSSMAMVPNAACTSVSNITVSPQFIAGGYTYSNVNQCNEVPTNAGGQTFDRIAAGSLDQGSGAGVTLTTAWTSALTITLWTLSDDVPEGGYAMLHSGSTGSPGPLPSYAMADADGNEVTVNSLSYNNPLVLPVGLSQFAITCTGNGAKLDWLTLTEQNSKNFVVEKSENGATAWTTVGSYNAAGNSSSTRNYEFVDLKGGNAFYRLKQVDQDGRIAYSAVQRGNCLSQQLDFLVYPIPARNVLNIVVGIEKNSKGSIQLLDVSGRIVRQMNTDLLKGTNNLKLNIAGLVHGEYFLKVVGSEILKTQKVTISQ